MKEKKDLNIDNTGQAKSNPTHSNLRGKLLGAGLTLGLFLSIGLVFYNLKKKGEPYQQELKNLLDEAGVLTSGERVIVNCKGKELKYGVRQCDCVSNGKSIHLTQQILSNDQPNLDISLFEYNTENTTLFFRTNHDGDSASKAIIDLIGYIEK